MPPPRSHNFSSRGEKVLRSPGLSVSMPASLKTDLRDRAESKGTSVSHLVRDLIEAELVSDLRPLRLGPDLRGELARKAEELGTSPEVLARALIRGGLQGMKGRPDAY